MPYVCRNCCCGITSDTFDRADDTNIGAKWTEVSGDWSIVSGTLRTSNTTAIAVLNATRTETQIRLFTQVRGATSNRLRLIFGHVDSNNYFYVQVIIGTAQAFSLVHRSGGSDTTLTSVNVTTAANTFYDLIVCINEGVVKASLHNAGSSAPGTELALVGYVAAMPASYQIGLGTGSNAGSSLQFDNFAARKNSESCELCAAACNNCNTDTTPPAFDVTLPTMTDNTCDCDPLSGATFRLYYCPSATGSTNLCQWVHELGTCSGSFLRLRLTFEAISSVLVARQLRIGLFPTQDCKELPTSSHTFSNAVNTGTGLKFDCSTTLVLPYSPGVATICTISGTPDATCVPVY